MSAKHRVIGFGVLALGLVLTARATQAQNPAPPNFGNLQGKFQGIQWQHGPCKATMRNIGTVNVPRGYKFTGEAGTATMMELTQNLPRPNDLGLLCPESWDLSGANDWFLVFEWDNVGYVKDDDKNLDANAILDALRKSQEQANQQLRARGFPEITVTGWEQAPFYDPQTNLLNWATRLKDNRGGMETVNYNSRILGRGGVMSVNLVISPQLLQRELPKYKEIVKATSFQPGQKYAEFRPGDKVATYGLAALVTGGTVAALAKTGLLGKLGKFLIYIVIGIAAVIGGILKKIFGRRSTA